MKEDKYTSVWVTLGFALSIGLIYYISRYVTGIEHFILSVGVLGPFVSILLYGILSVTPVPTDPITVLNGALFGPLVGILVSWWGNNLACVLEYFLGRGIQNIADFDRLRTKLPFGIGKLPVDSVWFLFCGRFIPQFGGKVVSLMGGIYKVPIKKYIWTAFLSNLIGSVILGLGGWALINSLRSL